MITIKEQLFKLYDYLKWEKNVPFIVKFVDGEFSGVDLDEGFGLMMV